MLTINGIDDLKAHAGQDVGVSDWHEVTQAEIDAFADATGDHQWIHVDLERAASGPFGTTIAHGFLTVSMVPQAAFELMHVEDASAAINYGLNKVRFPAPVPVGSKVRGRFSVAAVEEIENGVQVVLNGVAEREGQEKPVCAAELVFRQYR